jgi:hypothetical protein
MKIKMIGLLLFLVGYVAVGDVWATAAMASAIAGHEKSLRAMQAASGKNTGDMMALEEIKLACANPKYKITDAGLIDVLRARNLTTDGTIDSLVREACKSVFVPSASTSKEKHAKA